MDPNTTPFDDLPEVNAPLPLNDFKVVSPEEDDVLDEANELDAFREYQRESRGDNLTFGDY